VITPILTAIFFCRPTTEFIDENFVLFLVLFPLKQQKLKKPSVN